MKRGALCNDVVLHSMPVRVGGFETGDKKLWKIVDDAVEVIDRGGVHAGDCWRLAGDPRRDCCEIGHVNEAAPGHVDGKVIRNEEVRAEDGLGDVCHVEFLGERAPSA